MGSDTKSILLKNDVAVKMMTNYPWDGNVKLNIDPAKKAKFKVSVRVPGWYMDKLVAGNLYTLVDEQEVPEFFNAKINGKQVQPQLDKGYIVFESDWKKGDIIEFEFPMEVKMVKSKPELKQNENRIALQRGPLVYCVEGTDNNGKAWNILVPETTAFTEYPMKVLEEETIGLQAVVPVVVTDALGTTVRTEKKTIIAIPYYTWNNRGRNEMQVWLPTKIKDVKINY